LRYAKRIGVEMNECRDREQPVFASGFGIPIHGKNPLRDRICAAKLRVI